MQKKHIAKGLHYEEALEEALCFGWIDGQMRRIDDDTHRQWFCPRRKGSMWAPSNIARVKLLIKEKRMTAAGLQVFHPGKAARQVAPTVKTVKRITLPPDFRRTLHAHPKAWKHFQQYPKSFRLLATTWIKKAKKAETRNRRIHNVVKNAAKFTRPKY